MLPSWGAGKKTKKAEENLKREQEESKAKEDARRAAYSENGGSYYNVDSKNDRNNSNNQNNRYNNNPNNGSFTGNYKSYSTPDGVDRDELEEEIDNNLDEMSAGLYRLKMMGMAMNQEISGQTDHIRKITDRSDAVRDRIDRANANVKKVMK